MPDPLDPLGFLAATERLRRGLSIVPQAPPEHVVAAPGLGSRVLEGVGAVVGAPKAAVDALLRVSGRNVFRLELPEDYTTGRAIRELAGLSVEPGIADPGTSGSYAKRLAGAALEFGGDILTDPTVAAIAAKAPAAVTRLAAPLRAAAPAFDVAIPAVVPQVAGAAFTGLMTAGALESGRQAAETIGREGLSPQAAEELFHTGAAGLGALAGAGHIASRVRELRRLRAERGAPTAEVPEVELPPEVQSAVPPEVWAGDVPPGFEPRRAPAGPFPFPEAAFSPESEPFTLPVEVQAELVRRGETLPARRTLALEPRLPFVEGELVVERPELYPIGLDVPAIDAEFVRPLETLAERAAREQLTAPPTALALPEPLRQLPAPRPEVQQQPTVPRPEAELQPALPQLERAEAAPVPLPEGAEVAPRPVAARFEAPAASAPLEVDRGALEQQARARELVPEQDARAAERVDAARQTTLLGGEEGSFATRERAKPFYSALERAAEKIPQPMRAEDLARYLRDPKRAVKADELAWTGLDDFLESRKGTTVAPKEVRDFLEQNRVEVREITKGGAGQKPTKFSQWQEPGGENYREVLLTLPGKTTPENAGRLFYENFIREGDSPPWTSLNEQQRLKIISGLPKEARSAPPQFNGGHFDEPDILAHVRLNDRVDADGKRVLFIEEIQSDWAQKGRKQGFGSKGFEVKDPYRGWVGVAGVPTFSETPHGPAALFPTAEAAEAFARSRYGTAWQSLSEIRAAAPKVPRAPFVEDTGKWTDLALKRILRLASDEGYDRVAWTTGEMQAARYDLSKQVDAVAITKTGADSYDIDIVKDGSVLADIQPRGIPLREVEDTVGKDLARRAEAQPEGQVGEYSGLDLKVGGEGMRGYYDKIVPASAERLGKKFGARVGETTIGTVPEEAWQRLDDGRGGVERYEVTWNGQQRRVEGLGDDWRVYDERGAEVAGADSLASARTEAVGDIGGAVQRVHSIDITPQLRKVATEEGFPLFASREQAAIERDKLADAAAAEFRDQEIADPKVLRAEVERAMGQPYEPPAQPMTAARIRQAFPGVKLEERAGVYRGRINGVEVEVHPDATITVRDPKQAAAFARSATARGIEAGQAEAVGLTQTIDRRVIVRLAKGVDDAVVNHEALHVAMRLALNDKERRATLRKYGFDESGFKGTAEERTAAMRLAEERAAEAYSEWNPREPNGIFKRIATFFKNLYRQFFPDAEEVFRRVRSGEAFARGAAGDDLGAAFASRRRPLSESLWQKVLHPNRLPSFDIWFRDREGRLPSAQEAQGEAFAQYEREVNSPDGLRERALYEMSKSPELRTERLAKLDKMIESRAGVLSQIANAFESGRGGERNTADLDAARGVVRELRALTSARDTIRSRAEQEGYLTQRGLDPYPDQVDFAVRQHARATKAAPPTADERIETEPIGRPVEPGESPRVEQRVEDLRKAERDVGQPPAELDRETRRTWKSLDPEIRRVLREYDDDRFYNILKRRQLDDVEVQAWDARVRGKQERLDELDAEISSGRAAGRDVAEQERLSTAAALDYIAAQRAAVNDGTGTALALAARARVMEASRTPDDAFLRRVFREIQGVTDKQSAQLLKAFREDPSNLRPLLHQALATGKLRKILEWWKAGLLSAFSTGFANVSGSLAEHHIGLVETGVAAGVDKALASLLGGPRARFAGEFGAELAGGNTAFPAALRSLGRGLRDAVLLREKPFDPGRRIEYQVGAIGGTLGKVVRVPFAHLAAEDEFFKAWGGGAELGKLVHRKAASAGGSKDQIKARAARIAQELADPQNTDHIEILRAVERSKANRTFQERRPGSATEAITQLVQRQPLLNIALPFVHTPGNIANRILERSPYGFKRAASVYKNYRRLAREGASVEALAEARGQVADAITRPLVGTAVLAGFTGLAKAGALTGSGPTDPKERNLLRDTGWQPYSFVFTNAEGRKVYVPFNRFEPVSSLLGFAADLSEAQNSKTAGDLFDKGVGSVVQNLTSKSYLQGLTDAAELLSDPKRFGGQYVRNLTGSVVPNIVARAARVVDPTVRDVRPDEPGLKGLAESSVAAVVARLPFLSRTLQPRRSGTGEQVERSGSGVAQFFIPAPPSTEREGRDLERLLVEVDAVPSAPRRQIRVAGREIDLTAEEYAAMQDVDKRTTDLLRQSAATPEFQRLSSEQKRLLFKKAYDASRNAARKIIMARPEFRRRLLSVVRGAA